MRLRSNEPFWLLKNGYLNAYPSLRKSITCEALVVGAGVTGALMAYTLTQAGIRTAVIDRRDVGFGSTSASTAMLQYEIDTALHELIPMIGQKGAVRAYQNCREAIDTIEKLVGRVGSQCSFRRKESLYFANTPGDEDFLRKEFETRQRHGFQVEWLDRAALREKYNLPASAAIASADAAEIDAYRFAHDLIRAAVDDGLCVFDHVDILKTEYHNQGVRVLTDGLATIDARHVIYCTGYEAQEMLPEKVVKLLSTYAIASEPMESLPDYLREVILWNTDKPYLYLRTTNDNRVLIGGGDEAFSNAGVRDALIAKKSDFLTEQARSLYPDISFVPDQAWAGTFGETRDGLPYIGPHPDFPHSYFALGFGGNGITFSVTAAELIRDCLNGKEPDDLALYRFGR